jgi:ATP-dependent Lon protease
VTGQLGDVMRESAQAAVTYVRSNSASLGLELTDDFFQRTDIHLHVPAGAVPKDGPSAGVTLTTALVSALTGRPVNPSVAMTGEITLSGQVLPIGGVKEKVLAARRAGLTTVIIPRLNGEALDDIPPELRKEMRIVLADRIEEVLEVAIAPKGRRPRPAR